MRQVSKRRVYAPRIKKSFISIIRVHEITKRITYFIILLTHFPKIFIRDYYGNVNVMFILWIINGILLLMGYRCSKVIPVHIS